MEFRFRNSSLVICPRIPWMISRVENPWGLQWWLPWDQRRWRTILRKTSRSLFWLFWLRKMPKNSQRSSLFSLENYHLPGVFVSNIFLFSSQTFGGRWTHFDEHIFQMGWFNHQPVMAFFVGIYYGNEYYPAIQWWSSTMKKRIPKI